MAAFVVVAREAMVALGHRQSSHFNFAQDIGLVSTDLTRPSLAVSVRLSFLFHMS